MSSERSRDCSKCGNPVSLKSGKRMNAVRRADGGYDHHQCDGASGKYQRGERGDYLAETRQAIQGGLSLGART